MPGEMRTGTLAEAADLCPDRFLATAAGRVINHVGNGQSSPRLGAGAAPSRAIPTSARSSSRSSWSREKTPGFARPLDLDEPAAAEPDDVQVDLGGRVLDVVEVEDRLAVHDPGADGRDAVAEDRPCAASPNRFRRASATATKAAVIAAVRVPPSASRTSASTWIVQGPRALRVDDRAEAPADQALDLGRAAVGPARLAGRRAAGQHRVLGRQPADPLAFEERRDLVRELRRDQHGRRARAVEHAARAVPDEPALDRDRAELVAGSAVVSGHRWIIP